MLARAFSAEYNCGVLDLLLLRSPDNKRHLDLAGVGSVEFANRWGTKLVFTSTSDVEWRIDGSGPFRRSSEATDVAGAVVAAFTSRGIEHAGRVIDVKTTDQGLFERRPPFLIREGERDLVRVAARVWDEKPIDVTVLDERFAVDDPLLLLFALYGANLIAVKRQVRGTAMNVGGH